MSEAKPSDLSIMPIGMCASQLSMGRPKMRKGMPRCRKCAATESPYGPAPMIAVLSITLSYRPFAGKVAAKKYGPIVSRNAILPIKRKRDSAPHLVTFGDCQEVIRRKQLFCQQRDTRLAIGRLLFSMKQADA